MKSRPASAGGPQGPQQRPADPTVRALTPGALQARRAGGAATARRWLADPAFRAAATARNSRGGSTTAQMRRVCLECGLVTTPPALGTHQRWTQHTGWCALEDAA